MNESIADAKTSDIKKNFKLMAGDFCFRYRAISVVPMILICYFLFEPGSIPAYHNWINIAGFIISLSGGIIRVISAGYSKPATSGRENYLKAEDLNVRGTYSVVRNPLYLGTFLIYNGILIAYSSIEALIFMNVFFAVNYYFIIFSEENYLEEKFGDTFRKYKNRVPRMFPDFSKYLKYRRKFNGVKAVLREKNTTFYWVFFFIVSILLKQHKIHDGTIRHFHYYWIPVVILYSVNLILTLIKKKYPKLAE